MNKKNKIKTKENILNNIENKKEIDNILNDSKKIKLTQQLINDLFNKTLNIRKNYKMNDKQNIPNNFNSYLKFRKKEIKKNEKNITLLNIMKNFLGDEMKKGDWVQLLNIGNIIYLSALNEEDLDLNSESKYEILRDAILEKIIILTVSYFCISKEMYNLSKDKNDKKLNGEFFLYHAILLSEQYLPVSCPLVNYYINSYYNLYQKYLEKIPEGEIINYKIELIKNEIEENKDIQSFVKITKIFYKNENNDDILLPNNIKKLKNINNIKRLKNINNNEFGRNKLSLGLKLSLNLAEINNDNRNNNETKNSNSISKINTTQNIKLIISNESKIRSNPNIKNINENSKNSEIYQLIFNKKAKNILEKSKIRNMPKFKLNFNNIHKINYERKENKIYNGKNLINIINKIKINTTINKSKMKTYTPIGNKNYKHIIKNYGFRTERPKSNITLTNNDYDLMINNKKNRIKKNSFFTSFDSNKYLPKLSINNNQKSPLKFYIRKIK